VRGENRGRERGDEGGERRERGRCERERERRKVSSSSALGKKRKVGAYERMFKIFCSHLS